jgi:hypothetical protein
LETQFSTKFQPLDFRLSEGLWGALAVALLLIAPAVFVGLGGGFREASGTPKSSLWTFGTRSDVEGSSLVSPDQPWSMDGTADVTPLSPFPSTVTRNLPLEHRPPGSGSISREAYPNGLVIIWTDSPVSGDPATLHIRGSSGGSIPYGADDEHFEFPDGIVLWFLD